MTVEVLLKDPAFLFFSITTFLLLGLLLWDAWGHWNEEGKKARNVKEWNQFRDAMVRDSIAYRISLVKLRQQEIKRKKKTSKPRGEKP